MSVHLCMLHLISWSENGYVHVFNMYFTTVCLKEKRRTTNCAEAEKDVIIGCYIASMNIAYKWLSNYFLGESDKRRGGALKTEDRMKTFLRVVGDPGFQSGVGEDVGIHQTIISKTFHNEAAKIVEKGNTWLKFPESVEEMEAAKAGWRSKYSFPCAIGTLDCTQIPIKKPSSHGDEYVNRKGFSSLNVRTSRTCKFDQTSQYNSRSA